MLKKKVVPVAKTSIGLKCGDCLHFNTTAKFEKPCSALGVKKFSDAPACYSPNVYFLGRKNPDVINQLGFLLKDFTAQDQRILLALLKQGTSFEKRYNLKFGQPVYFCFGADYLSNYFSGFFIGGASAGDDQVFIGSDLKGRQRGKPMTCTLLRDSVYTIAEFKKKAEKLKKAGRLQDPSPLFNNVSLKKEDLKDEAYTPPTMDSAPPEWFNREPTKKSKAKLTSKKSLTRLDGKLEFVVNRK